MTASAATPGGTGAVRQAFELGKLANPNLRVFVSDPTWPNHLSILKYLGIPVEPYRYFDAKTRAVDFSSMMTDLENAKEVILFCFMVAVITQQVPILRRLSGTLSLSFCSNQGQHQ